MNKKEISETELIKKIVRMNVPLSLIIITSAILIIYLWSFDVIYDRPLFSETKILLSACCCVFIIASVSVTLSLIHLEERVRGKIDATNS